MHSTTCTFGLSAVTAEKQTTDLPVEFLQTI